MKKPLFKILSCLFVLFFQLVFFSKVYAFELVLKEQQINNLLAVSFPIQQHYQGVDILLTDPKVTLLSSYQGLKIKLVVTAKSKGQKLRAIASAQGQIKFDKPRNAIQIIEPSLTEFKVLDNTISHSQNIINTVKQGVGKQIPGIFFIDLNQLNQLVPGIQPKDISIDSRGLVIKL